MVTIASICARGGSQGVPRKNVRLLEGKPLIVHTIEQAMSCPLIDGVYVSTDDEEIAAVATAAGAIVPFMRPASLATSAAGKIPVIQHLVDFLQNEGVSFDKIVDLDPTSPLRELHDIEACIALLDENTDIVITGFEADKNPYFNMVEYSPDGKIKKVKDVGNILSRQTAPVVYAMNGSVYVWHTHSLQAGLWEGNAKLHIMPRERSVDIDSELDFKIVELLMQQRSVSQ